MKAVIFCGGVGTRMWPMSRKLFPKQFQPIIGNKSMFQQTLKRVKLGFKPEDIFISTGAEYSHYINKQAPEIPSKNIIAEPERKDTLGAVGFVTTYLHKKFGNTIMAAIWGADHLVENEKEFIHAFKVAGQICQQKNKIIKLDVRPTFPSIYNGWVKIGNAIENINNHTIYEFDGFIEKPDLKTAHKMFKSSKYLIHTGYNVWQTQEMLNIFKKYSPKTSKILKTIGASIGTKQEGKIIKQEYSKLEKTSIDFAIFEKLPPHSQIEMPIDIGWIDVGTWKLLYNGISENNNQNITQGVVETINTKGSLIYGPKNKLISTIGIKNLIIIDTKDALLVCDLNQSAQVKQLYETLKKKHPKLI